MRDLMFSDKLKNNTLAIARCEFHARSIYLRAFFALLAGFMLSLVVCPQFGFGLPTGHGISHVFWLVGPWACALFCGVFLLLCGSLCVSVVLNKFERYWFMRKTMGLFSLLPAAIWCVFMMIPNTDYVSVSYSLFWALGFLGVWLLAKSVSKKLITT